MEFFETVAKRRSVRKYKSTPVLKEKVERALDMALKAPNSSNLQLWKFVWVSSSDKKKALAEACFSQPAATTAQEMIVVIATPHKWRAQAKLMAKELAKNPNTSKQVLDYYTKLVPSIYTLDPLGIIGILKYIIFNLIGIFKPVPRGPYLHRDLREVAVKSAALACENIMLSLTADGLGTCPMEGFDECRVKKVVQAKSCEKVVMVISIGETDPCGIYGEQFRFSKENYISKI